MDANKRVEQLRAQVRRVPDGRAVPATDCADLCGSWELGHTCAAPQYRDAYLAQR